MYNEKNNYLLQEYKRDITIAQQIELNKTIDYGCQ